ncbi:hypothetical protein GCM10023196_082240 [Actinoallomurus vinaceus]|uniref:Uncharacterized protein n=1 Tax=Actinoallomurus vinaceus TaxID=1080074 RepID=A0ABP8UQI7_9ACTN
MSHDGGGYSGGHHGGFGGHHHGGFGGHHHHHHGADGNGGPGFPIVSAGGGRRGDVRAVVIFVAILAAAALGLLIANSG